MFNMPEPYKTIQDLYLKDDYPDDLKRPIPEQYSFKTKSAFTSLLIVTESKAISILADQKYISFTVPAGFITDSATGVNDYRPEVLGPAIIHDFLYRYQITNREIADKIFIEALKACHVKDGKSKLYYAGVRIGGYFAWKKHRKRLDKIQGKK